MIVVTGGAGFIGSVLVHELNRRGHRDIIIVDNLGSSLKWKNLVGLSFNAFIDKSDFLSQLEAGKWTGSISTIFHLGACSSTTEADADYLMANNTNYTLRLGQWWASQKDVRFIYASSAATYGDGQQGYSDDEALLASLRPLNMYGYSKHLFDLQALERGWLNRAVGLKYFNVFGPNEHHKGPMCSFISKAFNQLPQAGVVSLFASDHPEYGDGEQKRDFLYVKDAVAMTLYFHDNPEVHGIYNIGTGIASSWNTCARALLSAAGRSEDAITYVPMPQVLKSRYQYYTKADMAKLATAGCTHQCWDLTEAIADYVTNYLTPDQTVAWER